MVVRRSSRLITAPIVLAVAAVIVVAFGARGAVVGGPLAVYWLITAVSDYSKRLTISSDRLEMGGYLGGPIEIRSSGAVTCNYVKFRIRERSIELSFFDIRDSDGHCIKVWRYGWGRRSKEIFGALTNWLSTSSASVSPEAERALAELAT